MKFGIVNESTCVTAPDVARIAAALRVQAHQIAVAWERKTATISVRAPASTTRIPLVILDNADQAGALGYHSVTPDGRPYIKVFAKTILDAGGTVLVGALSVSGCCSHEMCEAFCDPGAQLWATIDGAGTQIALEACDPCQAVSYDIDGVTVSDFTLPAYFNPFAPGPYSYVGALTAPAPFLARGGYAIVENTSGERQVFGEIPEWKPPGRSVGRLHLTNI